MDIDQPYTAVSPASRRPRRRPSTGGRWPPAARTRVIADRLSGRVMSRSFRWTGAASNVANWWDGRSTVGFHRTRSDEPTQGEGLVRQRSPRLDLAYTG